MHRGINSGITCSYRIPVEERRAKITELAKRLYEISRGRKPRSLRELARDITIKDVRTAERWAREAAERYKIPIEIRKEERKVIMTVSELVVYPKLQRDHTSVRYRDVGTIVVRAAPILAPIAFGALLVALSARK